MEKDLATTLQSGGSILCKNKRIQQMTHQSYKKTDFVVIFQLVHFLEAEMFVEFHRVFIICLDLENRAKEQNIRN